MRDWLAVENSGGWDDAVRAVSSRQWTLYSSVCCTQCMLYSVYAVLGVYSWSWHGEIDRDDLTSCSELMVELRGRERERCKEMGQFIMRNWELREFHVRVNVPSPIQQVRGPIWWLITPIRGLLFLTRQVVLLNAHICMDPQHRSHLHPHLSVSRP